MCPTTGISYNEPAPHTFSFNSPQGACSQCNGLGTINQIDISKIIPNPDLSIKKGGIQPLGPYRNALIFWQLEAIAAKYKFSLATPIKDIPEEGMNVILYGAEETFKLENTPLGFSTNYFLSFEGVINYVANHVEQRQSERRRKMDRSIYTKDYLSRLQWHTAEEGIALFSDPRPQYCPVIGHGYFGALCTGFRMLDSHLNSRQLAIAAEILKELKNQDPFSA